jgi:hypothetical protein
LRTFVLALGATLVLAVEGSSAELTGTVKSTSGAPVPGVFIFYGRSQHDIEETDGNGFFSLPRHDRFVFFRRAGFRPITKIVGESVTKLDIVLEEASESGLILPVCPKVQKSKNRIGNNLILSVPKGAEFHKGYDTDYGYFSIGYGPKQNRIWLQGIYGPMATSGLPPQDWLLDASEFSERAYTGHPVGADVRGRSKAATRWRYIGGLGESVEYSGASEEAAAFFDKIIDGACVKR